MVTEDSGKITLQVICTKIRIVLHKATRFEHSGGIKLNTGTMIYKTR